MEVIKTAGRVFGARLTAAEKKALDIEVRRALGEHTKLHNREVAAIVLWRLRQQFGFSDWELWEFYRDFDKSLEELVRHYEMDDDDDKWLAGYMLKQEGIDLEEWEEKLENEKQERTDFVRRG